MFVLKQVDKIMVCKWEDEKIMVGRWNLMNETKYKVLIDNTVIAEGMDIEIAVTLVKALFEKYYNDHSITISVKEIDRVIEG